MNDLLARTRAVLSATSNYWQTLTETLPPQLLTQPPAEDEWSPLECLQHLIDVEHVMRSRLEAFLEGRDFPGFNPDEQGSDLPADSTPQALGEVFVRLRADNLAALARLTPQDFERQARHGEIGQVTLRQMLHHWAGHDLNHTIQAERVLLHAFIDGVGPWRRFYADHIGHAEAG